MSKIVVIGSCSVDFTTYAPRLPIPGETLIGTKFTTSYGGKGANQCVAAAKLGGKTSMISRGAGDAFVGALATYLVTYRDQPMHQIVGAACHVATLSVTKEGTQTSYPSKLDAFKKEYKFIEL